MEIKRFVIRLSAAAAVLYIAIGGLLYAGQDGLIFQPDLLGRQPATTPQDKGWAYQELWLQPEPGLRIHAWFIPHARSRGVVLLCHGNAGNIGHRLGYTAMLRELGLSVLLFDYRGFGRSEGTPSESGMYRDALAAWRYLADERGYAPGQIIVLGRSLGGAVAAYLARHKTVRGLWLESTFTSIIDIAARKYPLYPVRWLSKYRFNTLEHIGAVDAPVLIAHSREDEMVPFDHAQRLFLAAGEPKTLVPLQGNHNDAYWLSKDRYRQALRAFVETH